MTITAPSNHPIAETRRPIATPRTTAEVLVDGLVAHGVDTVFGIRVARAAVQSRLAKLEDARIIAGYHPHLDVAAAGFDVQCFVQLETVQVS